MRPVTFLIIAALAVGISVAVYLATGGHFVFFALPLVFALPHLARRRRLRATSCEPETAAE